MCVRRDEPPAAAADQISLRCLAIFLNGSLSVFALRRTAKVVRFRASAIVSTLFALRTKARSFLSCSGVQGARGVPFIFPSPLAGPANVGGPGLSLTGAFNVKGQALAFPNAIWIDARRLKGAYVQKHIRAASVV